MPKCSECGYLALRSGAGFLEVDDAIRNNGLSTSAQMPRCLMMKEEFAKEAAGLPREHGNLVASQAKEVIQRERVCDRFRKWSLGFTPKEHAEMDFASQILANQQVFQDAQARLADERHGQSMKIALLGTFLGAFATLVAGVLAISGKSPPPTINNIFTMPRAETDGGNRELPQKPVVQPKSDGRSLPSAGEPITPEVAPE